MGSHVIIALGLVAALAVALPHGLRFVCEPLVPWRLSIVMFGALFSAWIAASLKLRAPESRLQWLIPIMLAWIAPFYAWELARGARMTLDAATVGSVLYVALFASLAAYAAWNRGVLAIGANRAGVFLHLMPAFGSVLAAVLLGEAFRPFHLAGIALILAGVTLASGGVRLPPGRARATG